MKRSCDIAVIAAGILGLAHAWTAAPRAWIAAQRGLHVTLFERSPRANAALTLNFGMTWPIGQPHGLSRETALLSRTRWLELREAFGLWVNACGPIHPAYREDELAVLEEFTGQVILGDSHEYDHDISPFDKQEIDERIPRELRRIIRLPDWSIAERWHGIVAKYSEGLIYEAEPQPGAHVVVAPDGVGMTLSFGLAEQQWTRWAGTTRIVF
ncbi:MAG: hypothetical protein ACF8TS_10435 [Maioricimonas sp. JB049]